VVSDDYSDDIPEEGTSVPQRVEDRVDRRYNRYERESRYLNKRSEDYQVLDNVFDKPTMMVIYSLINDGVIKSVESHFGSGKESKVYTAIGKDGSLLALKIYLTVSAEFKKRLQYTAGDPRFEIKKGSRNMIAVWARREFSNMKAAHENNVRVPAPIEVRKNVLVMEFIGDKDGNAVPALVNLESVTLQDYIETIEQVSGLYKSAGLVHADLSEYNVFKTEKGMMLFDLGSAVGKDHPNAKQFLVRDIMNINRFFEKRGLKIEETASLVEKIISSGVKKKK
jgi:RIO kinase 1